MCTLFSDTKWEARESDLHDWLVTTLTMTVPGFIDVLRYYVGLCAGRRLRLGGAYVHPQPDHHAPRNASHELDEQGSIITRICAFQ